jgi:hypothetical protein
MQSVTTDGGSFLFEELLELLEQPQLNMLQEDCYLPAHAISGHPQHKAI